jgi:hypothetical protein
MSKKTLVIKHSNVSCAEACALCGERADVPVGPALFVEGTYEAVCRPCGIKHAPPLVGVLDRFWMDGYSGNHPVPTERRRMDHDTPKLAYNEGRMDDARRLLLEEHAKKKPVRLVQIDGHQVNGGDDVMHPDEDGHCLMGGEAYELRNLSGSRHLPVRVDIYEGADKQEVLALLRKIAAFVERHWDELRGLDNSKPRHLRLVEEEDEAFPF